MEPLIEFLKQHPLLVTFMIIWEGVWKLIGMWKAARNDQMIWFLCIAFIHIIGILPIIYLLINNKKKKVNNLADQIQYEGEE